MKKPICKKCEKEGKKYSVSEPVYGVTTLMNISGSYIFEKGGKVKYFLLMICISFFISCLIFFLFFMMQKTNKIKPSNYLFDAGDGLSGFRDAR